jgi:hypothetical protein
MCDVTGREGANRYESSKYSVKTARYELEERVISDVNVTDASCYFDPNLSCDIYQSINQSGCTALIWASRYPSAATATLLLDKGAKIDIADKVRNVIVLVYNMLLIDDTTSCHVMRCDHVFPHCPSCIYTSTASSYKCANPNLSCNAYHLIRMAAQRLCGPLVINALPW